MRKLGLLFMSLLLPAVLVVAQPLDENPPDQFDLAWVEEPLDAPLLDLAEIDALEADDPAEPGFCAAEEGRPMAKLNLTDEQKKKIQGMRLQLQKEMIPLRGDLQSKRIDMRSEMQADKPDLVKINALVDQMAKVRAEIQKKQIAMRFQVRERLSTEQLKIWDANKGRAMRHFIRERRGMRGPRPPRPERGPSL